MNHPKFHIRLLFWPVLWWSLATGCATMPTRPLAADGPQPFLASQYGRVVRVNTSEQYVILECAALPKAGEEFTLMRGNQKSGLVRITGQGSGKFAAADLIEGQAMEGDWFRRDRPPLIPKESTDL